MVMRMRLPGRRKKSELRLQRWECADVAWVLAYSGMFAGARQKRARLCKLGRRGMDRAEKTGRYRQKQTGVEQKSTYFSNPKVGEIYSAV